MKFWLPWPPSTNGLFVNAGRGGRNLSKRYREWREEAAAALLQQPQTRTPISTPISIHIALTAPTRAHRDASNYVKAVEDLIVQHGIIEDDDERFVRKVIVEWQDPPAGEPGAIVELKETTND